MASPVTAVVDLDTPIIRGEQRIEKVTVRKPGSGELRGVALASLLQMDVDALHTVLPRITDPLLTKQDVANLDPADLVQLGSEVAGFLVPKAARPDASPTVSTTPTPTLQ
ncbi:Phage tail assembly chaperone protein, E, or 41 or 14 [Andreprevotia lacus DSM 23236]|jgi:hypothetical protein|uniref:Phage tail assembly chaperone protein, E, or 41 or 14 n=1 Tax=Andreprevotia lacus DSM 23236 TaxID=1121001 RepID=A0A1W1XJX0_9NEIS|nr:phage tail assembly protein [Andreprevotia lacus]SMC24245.1 Phage tail assembly chaperone protein, E, or 41 or 14 [Andreprevotia lacus DSM 23236]